MENGKTKTNTFCFSSLDSACVIAAINISLLFALQMIGFLFSLLSGANALLMFYFSCFNSLCFLLFNVYMLFICGLMCKLRGGVCLCRVCV